MEPNRLEWGYDDMNTWNKTLLVGMAAAMATITMQAPAYAYVQPIGLNINQSYYLSTGSSISRVAVANPEIADIKILGASALNLVAKRAGTTTVNIWTTNGMRQEYMVTVSNEDKGLAAVIEKAIDLPNVHVQMVENRVLLRGTVQNQYEKELAFKIACLYVGDDAVTKTTKETIKMETLASGSGGIKDEETIEKPVDSSDKVVNLLEMVNPDQINIEAMVIEINSDAAQKVGMEYSSPSGSSGEFYAGEGYGQTRDKGSHWYTKNWLFTHFSKVNAEIHALIENGKARIISRPNITTMSGESAGILVGGEIPYPSVSSTSNNVTIEYKPYGIILKLLQPKVDVDGNITTKLEANVSRLDWVNKITANGYSMPGLTTRTARTVVNIPSGMTMAIGGLMNSEDSKDITKVPLLGDIPLIGELFKYHNNSRQKTEIMILITPRVVNESTRVYMSDKMQDAYNESRSETDHMNKVDVNEPVGKTASKEKNKATASQPAEKNNTAAPAVPVSQPKAVVKPSAGAAAKSASTNPTKSAEEYSLDHIVPPESLQGR